MLGWQPLLRVGYGIGGTVGTQSLAILQDGLIVAKNYATDILNLLFMSGLPSDY